MSTSGFGDTLSEAMVVGTGPCSEIVAVTGAKPGGVGGDAASEGGPCIC